MGDGANLTLIFFEDMAQMYSNEDCASFRNSIFEALQKDYDYIIAGAGAAGLSLLMRMLHHPFFKTKTIAVIDQKNKKENDRTWCFWEKENGLFDDIVYMRWSSLLFDSNFWSGRLQIAPYEYKMIRSADFYAAVTERAKQFSNVDFILAEIQNLYADNNYAYAKLKDETLRASYIFSSIPAKPIDQMAALPQNKNYYWLLQHFKGWMIETPTNQFDTSTATFMDFRVSQQYGTAFVYLLPVAPNRALAEYTLFTENLLSDEEYAKQLTDYLHQFAGISEWKILEEENGIIPMTNFPFPVSKGNIVYTGTAGGQTKPSSGYTFQFIQKHSDAIIDRLVKGKPPIIKGGFQKQKFRLYDSTLLNVLQHGKMGGDVIFADIFSACGATSVLRFLDNESKLAEDIRIMRSVPMKTFLPAAIKEVCIQIFR